MPKLFSIILFLVSIQGIGQSIKLKGQYDEVAGVALKSICFDDKNGRFLFTRFRLGVNNSDASLSGTGDYQINADTLLLIFDNNSENTQPLEKHEIISKPIENHNANMTIQVIDATDGKPVNGCSVTFESGSE